MNATFDAFDAALASNKLPVTGKVNERLVRSAYAALERLTPWVRPANLPNPLPSPHNLAWYFGVATCPDEVRGFATRVGHRNVRVWSVANDGLGWVILAQVFGAGTEQEAARAFELQAQVPLKSLRQHAMSTVLPTPISLTDVSAYPHEGVKKALMAGGLGHFVTVSLFSKV